MAPRYLTAADVAAQLQVSLGQAYVLLREAGAVKIRRNIRIREDVWTRWLSSTAAVLPGGFPGLAKSGKAPARKTSKRPSSSSVAESESGPPSRAHASSCAPWRTMSWKPGGRHDGRALSPDAPSRRAAAESMGLCLVRTRARAPRCRRRRAPRVPGLRVRSVRVRDVTDDTPHAVALFVLAGLVGFVLVGLLERWFPPAE